MLYWNWNSCTWWIINYKPNLWFLLEKKIILALAHTHFFSFRVKMLTLHNLQYACGCVLYLCWFVPPLPLLLILSSVNTHEHDRVCGARCYSTSVTHQRACANSQTDSRSITTVDRTLISRGISSHSRSRTNKLSPNIGFAWQWGSLWMCVCMVGVGGGWGCMHTSNRDGRSILGYGESTCFFKGEAYAQTSQWQLQGLSISRGLDRHFSFVALAGKTAYK